MNSSRAFLDPGHEVLLRWLQAAVRRVTVGERLRWAGWALSAALLAAALYLALRALRIPEAVLTALVPLLGLTAAVAIVMLGWRCLRSPDPLSVAAEVDARGGLKNEVQSAYWFVRQDRLSAWEALLVRRATQSLAARDPGVFFPLRMPASVSAAAALGALVLGFTFAPLTTREADTPVKALGAPGGTVESATPDAPASADGEASAPVGGEQTVAATASTLDPLPSGSSASQANGTSAIPTDVATPRAGDSAASVQSHQPRAVSARDALDRAAQVSVEVARGIADRLSALFGKDGESTHETAFSAEGMAAGSPTKRQEAHARDTEMHVTMEQLSEALRALSQAPTGDAPMPASPPGDGSEGSTRGNIQGGAMGVRVNTSELGEGGSDEPPDADSESPNQPVLGDATARRTGQAQQLGAQTTSGDTTATSDDFYVASQAQAARLGVEIAAPARQAPAATALPREEVPLAYRASVKRYFLLEHSKER